MRSLLMGISVINRMIRHTLLKLRAVAAACALATRARACLDSLKKKQDDKQGYGLRVRGFPVVVRVRVGVNPNNPRDGHKPVRYILCVFPSSEQISRDHTPSLRCSAATK